jgi:uncharacterized damage-inducible protein DinB
MSIRRFYDKWPQYNRRIAEVVGGLTDEQLAIRHGPQDWPIWAIVGHTAGARAYWLCGVLAEPGVETTPFPNPLDGDGWEDDLSHPRSVEELVWAMNSTGAIIERVLDTWTPDRLDDTVERMYGSTRQVHPRGSILQRLLSHDAWHAAQLSDTLALHGLPGIDLWRAD